MNLSVQPTVSIIIPAYNPPMELFKKCVATILNQGELNSEILIVDDGSKPVIAAAIDNVAAREKNIRVIHQINAGEGAARNTGLDNATGKYVLFVDADDGLASGWVSRAIDIAESSQASVVMGRVVQVQRVPDHEVNAPYEERLFTSDQLWELQRDFLLTRTKLVGSLSYLDPGVCSKLIRRDCIDGLRFPVGLKLSSDQVFNHELLRRAKNYVVTDATAYYYVSNGDSVSHVYNPDAASVMMRSMGLVKEALFDNESVSQAFYFRVLMELGTAIQFSAFSDRHPTSYFAKKRLIAQAASEPLFIEAMNKVKLSSLPDFAWRIKALLLEKGFYGLYILLKWITD